MRRLRPHLYFGPSIHAPDVPRLRSAGITAVLSLQQIGVDIPNAAVERVRAACDPDIAFHNIGVPDYDPQAIVAALPLVLRHLAMLVLDGRIVYVHCSEGINRAPSIALAYLVRYEDKEVDDALEELLECDPGASPYPAIVHALRA